MMNLSGTVRCFCVGAVLAAVVCASPVFSEVPDVTEISALDPNMAVAGPDGEWLWYAAEQLAVEGKGWLDTEAPYHRLPERVRGVVRDPVWSLGTHSAGICIRFVSNSNKVAARWTVASDSLAMPHMPATGVSGVDLYVKAGGRWQWIGNGRPTARSTESVLASGIPAGDHEFLLYLPLYNGTESLEIGVLPNADLSRPPLREENRALPIVFYGTSITHGGCASRPGMAYPAILGRRLDRPVINLGFSGNGKMDAEVGTLLAELDAAAFVLDCAPNMTPEMITERTGPFVTALRAARPETPIVLVECIQYQAGFFLPGARQGSVSRNKALQSCYEQLVAQNIPRLHHVSGELLLGDDGEATVDGTHPTDLGFMRIADALEPVLHEIVGR